MTLQALLLVGGLALIIRGGDLFVSASVRIAEHLRMPRVVIGSTFVSLATTSPELVVSVVAALQAQPGLAVGNALGSCIANLGLILGWLATVRRVEVHPTALAMPLAASVVLGALLFLMTLDLRLSRPQGTVLLAVGTAYFVYDFRRHWRATDPADVKEAGAIQAETLAGHGWLRTRRGAAAQFLVGAALVVVGSRLLVDTAINVAAGLGVSTILIGLTVVALGTSLPELATAVASFRRNVSDLAVGNVLGANIANLSLIVGVAAALHDVTMDRPMQVFNFAALLGALALVAGMLTRRRITRPGGVVLLAYYAAYLVALVMLAL